jgi:hypothetical protein
MSQNNGEPASTNSNSIRILPSSAEYADQMEELTGTVYECNPRESEGTLTADHFRQHLNVFPEGQFIAVDALTQRVVGLTASMRTTYDPRHLRLEPWWDTIGYG